MSKFIGVKMVEAVPMTASEAINKGYRIGNSIPDSIGYEVTYTDGYKSWCPKDVFEKANRPIDNMTFGFAIEALKKGFKVSRKGWNGKGMYLWLKAAVTIKSDWCKDPMLKEIVDANGGEAEAFGTICMKTADNKILSGWLASQTDVLSEDWVIIE
jgi:hypothetical protein